MDPASVRLRLSHICPAGVVPAPEGHLVPAFFCKAPQSHRPAAQTPQDPVALLRNAGRFAPVPVAGFSRCARTGSRRWPPRIRPPGPHPGKVVGKRPSTG